MSSSTPVAHVILPPPPTMPPHLRVQRNLRAVSETASDVLAVDNMIQPAERSPIPTMMVRHVVLDTPAAPLPVKEKKSRKGMSSVKDLPKDKVIIQDPATRKGGGSAWTPVQYADAIKLQNTWLENRWCLAKIRNEFVGDKMLSEAGEEAGKVIAFRETVLKAYMNLVEKFLALQTEIGPNGLEVVGAKFAYSKIAAIIGTEEAKGLKETHARIVTQVSTRKDTWYACLTPVSIARAVSQAREAESTSIPDLA